MLPVRIRRDRLHFGPRLSVSFQRTLRIPDDGRTYPLPPGLGNFPIRRVSDYAQRVDATWRRQGGVFIPMYQREALWLNFDAPGWHPCALQVFVGNVNAISGKPRAATLVADPQDYVVCPDQPWLDGINAGQGFIRQFVALPLGMGYTVEGQVTGAETTGGLQLLLYAAKPGRFPDRPPEHRLDERLACICMCRTDMGLGAGGRMRQAIYPDEYGIDTWETSPSGRVFVHIVNSLAYREITGEEPPPTPVTARTYAEHGLPWFELYDEARGDIAPSPVLATVKSTKEMDGEKGFAPQQDDTSVEIPANSIKTIASDPSGLPVIDGEW